MRHIPTVVGILLGLLFLMASLTYFLNLVPPQEPPPKDSLMAMFMGAFAPSGYLNFVKTFELIGGVLVMIPRTRNLGLLVLGPIILNILAFHAFITKGEGLLNPMIILIVVAALYLLWVERKAFAGLVNRGT
jgi:putative oxidoreductase